MTTATNIPAALTGKVKGAGFVALLANPRIGEKGFSKLLESTSGPKRNAAEQRPEANKRHCGTIRGVESAENQQRKSNQALTAPATVPTVPAPEPRALAPDFRFPDCDTQADASVEGKSGRGTALSNSDEAVRSAGARHPRHDATPMSSDDALDFRCGVSGFQELIGSGMDNKPTWPQPVAQSDSQPAASPIARESARSQEPEQPLVPTERPEDRATSRVPGLIANHIKEDACSNESIATQLPTALRVEGPVKKTTPPVEKTSGTEAVSTASHKSQPAFANIEVDGLSQRTIISNSLSSNKPQGMAEPPLTISAVRHIEAPEISASRSTVAFHATRLTQQMSGPELRFKVHSETAGQVQLSTSLHQRDVEMAVSAERPETAAAMRAELPTLDARLRDHALRLGDVSIGSPAPLLSTGLDMAGGGQRRPPWSSRAVPDRDSESFSSTATEELTTIPSLLDGRISVLV